MIALPESIQEIVGRKIARIFTSHPGNDQLVFDLETSSEHPRTRFAYEINGQISSIWNHGEMVGYTVSEIRALDNEPDGRSKMAIFTDDGARFGVIYFIATPEAISFITEGEDDLVQEEEFDCSCLLLEASAEDGGLVDLALGRRPPFATPTQYIVQEDDVRFETTIEIVPDTCPCDDEET